MRFRGTLRRVEVFDAVRSFPAQLFLALSLNHLMGGPKSAPAASKASPAPTAAASNNPAGSKAASPNNPASSKAAVPNDPASAAPPADAKALSKAPAALIGHTSGGAPVYAAFQPSVASLAVILAPFLRTAVGLETATPLPAGMELIRAPDDSQTQLKLSPLFASENRRIFGYVAEIKLSSGEGADTPSQLQVARRAPWRYGVTSAGRSYPSHFLAVL